MGHSTKVGNKRRSLEEQAREDRYNAWVKRSGKEAADRILELEDALHLVLQSLGDMIPRADDRTAAARTAKRRAEEVRDNAYGVARKN